MSTARGAHEEACLYAMAQAEALTNRIAAAREKQAEVLAAVVNATGEQPSVDSAQAAYEWIQLVGPKLDEAMDVSENVRSVLESYMRGW